MSGQSLRYALAATPLMRYRLLRDLHRSQREHVLEWLAQAPPQSAFGTGPQESWWRWLVAQLDGPQAMTWGLPQALSSSSASGDFDDRLFWWPHGIPAERRVAVLSSRLGRQLAARREWFAAFRSVCEAYRNDRMISAPGTATDRFLQRAVRRLGCRVLTLHEPAAGRSLHEWLVRLPDLTTAADDRACAVYLSPPISPPISLPETACPDGPHRASEPGGSARTKSAATGGGSDRRAGPARAALRDRLLVGLADECVVLHLRPGGQVAALLESRLAAGGRGVWFAAGPGLVPARLAESLAVRGAAPWCKGPLTGSAERSESGAADGADQPGLRALDDQLSGWFPTGPRGLAAHEVRHEFLLHCTRRPDGPWPDESEEDYLDALILGHAGPRENLDALLRIVRQGRIRAGTAAIRGRCPVVSLTAVSLHELNRHRAFRPHRHRWDFEPYGVGIRRRWLQERGARPVRYGDDRLWDALDDDQRPFFQRRWTRTRQTTIDWQREREWRVPGDVLLRDVPADDAFLFVPSAAEIPPIARWSRWPVLVVPGGTGSS